VAPSSQLKGVRRILLKVAAGIIAFGMGCGEGTAPPPPVATVSIAPTTVDIVPGGTEILQATAKDAGGNALTNRITEWSSTDPSKATVAAGVVTGVGVGAATITATVEGHSASAEVNVREGAVVSTAGASFSVLNSVVSLDIPAGALTQTRNITVTPATTFPANERVVPGTAFDFGPTGTTFAQPVTVSIKYDPSKVINSPDSGLRLYEVVGTDWRLVPESSVNTETKAVTGKVNHFTVYGVLLQAPVATITINRDTTVQVQTTVQFSAALKDVEQLPLNRVVAWESSNPAIVSIDANGLARALLPGQSTITANVEGKSATAVVTALPGPPTALEIAAGDGQTAVAGGAVTTLPAVRVTDAFGNPISGFAITFAVASGGGTITGAAATTNASGIATVGSWTLGASAGPNTLTASGSGLTPPSVTFTASGGTGAPATVVAVAGDNQSATAGAAVATPPSVKVTDANANPVDGFTVVFTPGAGSGTVGDGSAVTNSSGIAAPTSWVLGSTPGTQTLLATAGSLTGSPVTFSATALAPVPAKILRVSADPQSATIGKPVGDPPAVRILDPANIPVPGQTVAFDVTSGGGTVTGGVAVTDANGLAAAGSWFLGPAPGPNSVTATAGALQLTFSATAIAPVAAKIVRSSSDPQAATTGTAVGDPPAVRVLDASNNPVAGQTVSFSVTGGGGSITGGTAVSNESGFASVGSWTLGASPGTNTLTATAGGLQGSPMTFTATGVAAPPVAMSISAGQDQSALAGSQVPIRPAVLVTDAKGVGVSGVAVTFSIGGGSGSISGANAVTNGSGIATLGSWTVGMGGNSLLATSNGLAGSPLVFNALGTAPVQVVTFGDSNTDYGFSGNNFNIVAASYVSNVSQRLGPNAPNNSTQLAGKIESRWRANRSKTIVVVNHAVGGTTTGAGRTILLSPNAREPVKGVTRFEGEALGVAYPWSGGEPASPPYPSGPVARVQAFTPRTSDFLYISMGTNDPGAGISTASTVINLEWMVDLWIARGIRADHIFVATLPPRPSGQPAPTALNAAIRSKFGPKGVNVIDIERLTSNDNGSTWKSASLHVGDELHYAETVRDTIADQIVSVLLALTPP
jgi:adhesin/invasin